MLTGRTAENDHGRSFRDSKIIIGSISRREGQWEELTMQEKEIKALENIALPRQEIKFKMGLPFFEGA
jgi:hypothetical protein